MGETAEPGAEFEMCERFDPDGALRLALSGELDLSVAQALSDRLTRLRSEGYLVRVDLARLAFIDSSGLRALVVAVSHARRDGGTLEIDRQLTEPVQRVIDITHLGAQFWPNSD